MDRTSRKHLKEDRFVQEVGESVSYLTSHGRQLLLWGGLIAAIVVGGALYWRHREEQRVAARHAFQAAMNVYYGEVSADARPGVVTFATTIERNNRVQEELEKVISDYSGTREADAARYYLAIHKVRQGETDEARQRLQALTSGADKEIQALARLAFAELLQRQDDTDGAREQLEALVKSPSQMVPKERAQVELATLLVEKDPKAARPILEDLANGSPALAGQARALLSTLPAEEAAEKTPDPPAGENTEPPASPEAQD